MKKFAIIGCGNIGWYHLEHLMQFEDIELAGFCDVVLARAEAYAQKAGGGAVFTDYREMFDTLKPDAVFLSIPPGAHGVIELEAIARRIHMFVQKPVSNSLRQARHIAAAIENAGLISAVGFQCRYDNINEPAKAFVAEHPVVTVQASRVGGVYAGPDWWRVRSASGGMLMDAGIHQMDMMRYLLGKEPVEVFSFNRGGFVTNEECVGYDIDDVSVSAIRFGDGTTAVMTAGCYSVNGASWDSKMTFGARDCRMEYELCRRVSLFGTQPEGMTAGAETVINAETVKGDGTQRRSDNEKALVTKSGVDYGLLCDRTFVDAVITGDPRAIRSPYADAVKSLAFVLACNQSMDTGLPVKVDV